MKIKLEAPENIETLQTADSKPYPNEHAARIKDPGEFDEFRRKNNHFGEGVHAIFGIKKEPKKTELQAIRFDKSKWTVEQAKQWLKDHEIECLSFEPASEKSVEIEKKQFAISECKMGRDEKGNLFITGYANTKFNEDRYGDVPQPFERDYVYDLSEFKKNPVLLLDHFNCVSNIAGSFNEKLGGFIEEDEVGLKFKAVFSNSDFPALKHARKVYEEGHGRALSIGGRWYRENPENEKQITLAEILEVSLVGVGADPNAVTDLKSAPGEKGGQKNLHDRIAELEESIKAGRVLSKANEQRLVQAKDALEQVLGSLEKPVEKRVRIIKGGKDNGRK